MRGAFGSFSFAESGIVRKELRGRRLRCRRDRDGDHDGSVRA